MKFYIEPITRDITDFHRSCVLAMSQLRNAAVDQRHQAEEQAKRIQKILNRLSPRLKPSSRRCSKRRRRRNEDSTASSFGRIR